METINLIHGECLAEMDKLIANNITVHAIITDIPFGTTICSWDSIIPFEAMWDRLNKIIKPNGAICLFGSQPFTSLLVSSNIESFKYEWIYQKKVGGNFATVKYQPMKEHQNVCIFSRDGERINYYPILQRRIRGENEINVSGTSQRPTKMPGAVSPIYSNLIPKYADKPYDLGWRTPSSVQVFNNKDGSQGLHPTQKPVALMEYFVKTYTQENEIVLDFTAGSFTTAIACINTNRQFIGIELEAKYYNIGVNRVNQHNGLLK